MPIFLAILAGVGIGAVAFPHKATVGETEISNPDAYAKEYLPVVMAGGYCQSKEAAENAHRGDRLR